MSTFSRKLNWLLRRRRKEAELEEELHFHLEEEAEQRRAEGLPDVDARWAARRDLGNTTLLREDTRATWTWTVWEQFLQDVRYALRTTTANKAFSALAILSLALGIGASTAIFSFMDSLLLRSLPVHDPESLAVLNWHIKIPAAYRGIGDRTVVHAGSGSRWEDPKKGTTAGIFPYPAFEMFRKQSSAVFSSIFAYYPVRTVNLIIKGQAELATGEYVSGDFFRGLGIPQSAGRLIQPDDDRAGAPAVAVLSFTYGQKHFGDVANAAGQTIHINGVPFTVVGVAPPGFYGVDPAEAPDFYIPIHANLLLASRGRSRMEQSYLDQNYYWIEMMGRLSPGVSIVAAQAALAPPFRQWAESTAKKDVERAYLPALSVREGDTGLDTLRRNFSEPLYVLLAMVGLILAIACANIASLLLARAAARRREMAVRLSLGAGRLRVIRQLLTESVVLACMAGAVGVLFAVWGIRFLTLLLANGREDFTLHAELNWHVLGVAFALSLVTGVLFGLAPAIQSTRVDVMPALKVISTGRVRAWSRLSLGQLLVTSQIAISLILLVAAGLFVRTLSNLQSIQLGFNSENVLLFRLNALQAGHKDPEIVGFYGDLWKRFSGIPGVSRASLSNSALVGEGAWYTSIAPVGKQPDPSASHHILTVGAGFFSTMQIPLLAGREIDERDQLGSQPVAVVNEAFAKANFGTENPLGRRLSFMPDQRLKHKEMEIVGIAKNARYGDALTKQFPEVVYVPYNQGSYFPVEEMTFALRTAGDPMAIVKSVRDIVRQADPRVPVANIRSQASSIDQTMNQEIIFARLCTMFAILALTIACVGLYGSMSYNVARRTNEIGIRMALGARRGIVVWMVLREVLALSLAGLAISLPACLAAGGFVKSFLFGLRPNDPLALGAAICTLFAAVMVAGYAPARKASRIEPVVALRHE